MDDAMRRALLPTESEIRALPLGANTKFARDLLGDGRKRALDIGCGEGKFTRGLAGFIPEVAGIDVKEKSIAKARAAAQADGARVDFEGLPPGHDLMLANLEIVPVVRSVGADMRHLVVNAGGTAIEVACPLPTPGATGCPGVRRLGDDRAVQWPLTIGAHRSEILHPAGSGWPDADADAIPDDQDRCPGTPPDAAVDSRGCPLTLR